MSSRKRTVLYGRTSLDKSDGRSVDDQLAELRRWADREGRDVVAELRDDGRSASRYARKARPAWTSALELIVADKVDELAVWEISRSTRDRAVWAALIAACIEHGVFLVVNGKVHDPADPDDGFMLDLGAALAVRESAVTSKRTLRGVESRAPQGRPHGALNYGYRIEYDPATGKPLRRVIDEPKAAVVREIAQRLLAGESASGIARDLNARHIPSPTGRKWIGGNMAKTVEAPALAGLRVHRGQVLPDVTGTWPPILKAEEHHRLVALLSDPVRMSRRTGEHVKHMLVGIATCGVCGGRIRTLTKKRVSGERLVNYGCAAKFCVTRRAEPVDQLVEKVAVAFLSRSDVAAELAEDDTDAQAAAARVAELRAELARAREMHRSRTLSLDSLAAMEAWALPEIAQLEPLSRPKHVPSIVYDVAGPGAGRRWKATPVHGRRVIVGALFDVQIHPAAATNQFAPFDPTKITVRRRGTAPDPR